MIYQRIKVSTGAAVGDPGPLPADLAGMDDASLADLSKVLVFPEPRYADTGFVPYAQVLAAQATLSVDVPTFMLRFTPQERISIRASDDPFVKDFMALLDDPRTVRVNLDLPAVQEAIGYLAGESTPPLTPAILTADRVSVILAPQTA